MLRETVTSVFQLHLILGQTISAGEPVATLSGVGIINLGVNGVAFQALSSKVTNVIIPKTLSTSSSEEYIKTFELGTLATSSATDVTSACRIGSN